MSTWHVDDDLAGRYAAGSTNLVLEASVETHLLECAACRDSVTGVVSAQRLDDIWARVSDKLEASPTPAERLRRWWRVRSLPTRFAIALTAAVAAAVAFAVASPNLGLGHLPGGGTSPSGQAQTRPTAQNINAENDPALPGLAGLTVGLTIVDGRLMSSYDPPYRVVLDDPHTSATVTERNISGLDRKVVPRAAVIRSPSGTWVYTITDTHMTVRQQVTVSAENDGITALSDGPPAGTEVLTFTID